SAIAAASVPASAFAVDYMTADQAAKLIFPDADAFEARSVALDATQLQQLDAQGVRGRSATWPVRVAKKAGATLGFVVTDEVIGKVELISYAVGIALDGNIRQVEILSYRESHGFEIRLPAWRRQFVGKGAGSALRVGDDIANISGATLSCTHVTDGVRRIVAVVALARRGGGLP
ncbi:MAG TPA: FMN-binding protein, partial [Burkholderiaceae bacterium]|nr:FMN-binding protein [Burkholderiaceae bacterium]